MSDPQPLLKAIKPLETSNTGSNTPLIFSTIPAVKAPSYRYKITIQYPLTDTDPNKDSGCRLFIQVCCACCTDIKVKEGAELDQANLIHRLETQILYQLEHENVESFKVEIYDGNKTVGSFFNNKEALLKFMSDELGYQRASPTPNPLSTQNISSAAFTRN